MLDLAALLAIIFAGVGTLFSCLVRGLGNIIDGGGSNGFAKDLVHAFSRSGNGRGQSRISIVTENFSELFIGGFSTFVAVVIADWAWFYWGKLPFIGANAWWILFMNAGLTCAIFGFVAKLSKRLNASIIVAGAMALIMFIGGIGYYTWPVGSDNAKKLANLVHVDSMPTSTDDPLKGYPDTDDNHMVIVGDQAARFIAHQAMNTNGIGTRYKLGDGNLQSVQGHMYYIFELLPTSWGNTKAVQYTVSGYVVVDAEDQTTPAQLRTTYTTPDGVKHNIAMHWWPGGIFGGNLERYVWMNGYNGYYVDNLTLEVDDNWQPFYTASINKAPLRWEAAIPVGFISVDAEAGKITRYPLNQVPTWVDRVYSADTAKNMLNWWGTWGQAPYKIFNAGTVNRYKVDGEPTLVYTKEGPAWQALMTSQNDNDKSVRYIALFDTRANNVRMYTAPNGLVVQDAVKSAFSSSGNNLKGLDPTSLALHKIDGELVWVGSLVANNTGDKTDGDGHPEADSFQGVGMLSATTTDGANVIIGVDKGTALDSLATQIANGVNNAAPNSNSQISQTITGTVLNVNEFATGGNTDVVIQLSEDLGHVYVGRINPGDINSLEMAFLKAGDKISVLYVDLGKPTRQVNSVSITTSLSPTATAAGH